MKTLLRMLSCYLCHLRVRGAAQQRPDPRQQTDAGRRFPCAQWDLSKMCSALVCIICMCTQEMEVQSRHILLLFATKTPRLFQPTSSGNAATNICATQKLGSCDSEIGFRKPGFRKPGLRKLRLSDSGSWLRAIAVTAIQEPRDSGNRGLGNQAIQETGNPGTVTFRKLPNEENFEGVGVGGGGGRRERGDDNIHVKDAFRQLCDSRIRAFQLPDSAASESSVFQFFKSRLQFPNPRF